MLLVVDIGNTNITFALYKDTKQIQTYRITTRNTRTSDEYGFLITSLLRDSHINKDDIQDVIIASVVPKIMHSFTNSIRKFLNKEPMIVGPGSKTGITVKFDNPKEVGADRIVDAVGAHYTYGGDILVIDFGTATTFEYVDDKGVYNGGCICPGIQISAQALTEKTAKLPEIEIKKTDKVLCSNTINGMQAGLFYGYVGQVEYIIKKCKEETGKNLKVVATGGLGRVISNHTNLIDIYDPDLTFKGLVLIYKKTKNIK